MTFSFSENGSRHRNYIKGEILLEVPLMKMSVWNALNSERQEQK